MTDAEHGIYTANLLILHLVGRCEETHDSMPLRLYGVEVAALIGPRQPHVYLSDDDRIHIETPMSMVWR